MFQKIGKIAETEKGGETFDKFWKSIIQKFLVFIKINFGFTNLQKKSHKDWNSVIKLLNFIKASFEITKLTKKFKKFQYHLKISQKILRQKFHHLYDSFEILYWIVSLPMDLQESFQIDWVLLEDATKTENQVHTSYNVIAAKCTFSLKK